MVPIDFTALAQQCAPHVAPATLAAIVKTESGFNPFAIGVVGGHLERQPKSRGEALATARQLERNGWNYSVGLAQVNRSNFVKYGLTLETAFEPCMNLTAGSEILRRCFESASGRSVQVQQALRTSFSCYYAGDAVTGYRTGYVQRVVANAAANAAALPASIVPAIETGPAAASNAGSAEAIPVVSSGKVKAGSRQGPDPAVQPGASGPADGADADERNDDAVVF